MYTQVGNNQVTASPSTEFSPIFVQSVLDFNETQPERLPGNLVGKQTLIDIFE